MTNDEALRMAYSKRKDSTGEERDFLNTIIQALVQTRWIPVSQKLPDKYGIYLVTLNNHDTDFCEFYPNDRTFGMNGNVCYEVTAWMPLPPSYQGESEAQDAT